jgi:hypothetical protein
VVRVMMTAIRVAGDKEGGGGKGHCIGNKGGMQQRGQWHWLQEHWQQGWRVSNSNKGDGNGNIEDMDNGNRDEAGGQQ